MPHLHIDCFSGLSGDMFLGALVDVGLPLSALKRELRKIQVGGYQINARKVHRGSIQATKCDVLVKKGFSKPLSLPTIRKLISTSQLSPVVKSRSLEAFNALADAEGTVHGVPPSRVHFHEVGVVDSFIDIVGAFVGCANLNIETVSATPVNVGSGTVESAHGTLPVPGPAVAHLAKGLPIFSEGPPIELTTPTGMSIITVLTGDFGSLPPMCPTRVGYGAGTQDPPQWPNVLRVFVSDSPSASWAQSEQIIELQTNVDDLNPQIYEALMERLFSAGAVDVTLTPVIMKRSRPGTVISVLAPHSLAEVLAQILFQETTTLGVRIHDLYRWVLPRSTKTLRLPNGSVRVKIADLGKGKFKVIPEFQDCKQVADKSGRPVRDILAQVRDAFLSPRGRPGNNT